MTNILTGDELKKQLIIKLFEIKKDKKFVMNIYHMLQTEQERLAMFNYLDTQKNLKKLDVEVKSLEITEPRYREAREKSE